MKITLFFTLLCPIFACVLLIWNPLHCEFSVVEGSIQIVANGLIGFILGLWIESREIKSERKVIKE